MESNLILMSSNSAITVLILNGGKYLSLVIPRKEAVMFADVLEYVVNEDYSGDFELPTLNGRIERTDDIVSFKGSSKLDKSKFELFFEYSLLKRLKELLVPEYERGNEIYGDCSSDLFSWQVFVTAENSQIKT